MEKQDALWIYSNKVYLQGYTSAQAAVIELSQGLITDIQIVDDSTDLSVFPNLIDYRNFCVLPGLIDWNVKTNEDSISRTTLSALKGGVTTLALEEPFHNFSSSGSALFCDIGLVRRLAKPSDISDALIYKVYLCPQSSTVPSVNNLEQIVGQLKDTGKTLIVDCSMPQPRILHVASPYRMKPLNSRLKLDEPLERVGDFSMAVDVTIKDCLSDDESPNEEEVELSFNSLAPPSNSRILERRNSQGSVSSRDLAESIDKMHLCMKELRNAELETYSQAGDTSFRSKSDVMSRPPLLSELPPMNRLASLRPTSLKILKPVANENSYNYYLMNVPATWECSGIEYIYEVLKRGEFGKVHFSNIASAEAVAALVKAKDELENITWDTCPHYLYISSDDIRPKETAFKTFPPIRTHRNRELMVEFLVKEGIHMISSHHNPVNPVYKVPKFRSALPGISTLGSSLNVVWSILKYTVHPNTAMNIILNTMCYEPAAMLGISHIKGGISVNKQADLVIWDPNEQRIQKENNIYQDKMLYGKVVGVFLRGKLVFAEDVELSEGSLISN